MSENDCALRIREWALLALAGACMALYMRQLNHTDAIVLNVHATRIAIGSSEGVVFFGWSDLLPDRSETVYIYHYEESDSLRVWFLFEVTGSEKLVGIPNWLIAMLFVACPVWRLRSWARRRRVIVDDVAAEDETHPSQ